MRGLFLARGGVHLSRCLVAPNILASIAFLVCQPVVGFSRPSQPQGSTASPGAIIPPTLFSMHLHSEVFNGMPWSSTNFAGIRLWDTYTNWSLLNPSRGVFDWKQLDAWLNLAEAHGADVLYTFGGTPAWASSNPTGICAYANGSCYPPANLQAW